MKKLLLPFMLLTGLVAACWMPLAKARAFTATVQIPQVCTTDCRVVDVTRYGVKPNDGQDDAAALNALLKQVDRNAVLDFPPGRYEFSKSIRRDGLSNVLFRGQRGAEMVKLPGFKEEYLLYLRFGQNIGVSGLTFRGLTRDRKQARWGESGLYLASSHGTLVIGSIFKDFGDAAIRITSSMAGTRGVASSNAVVRNNTFENVTQITTTSNQNGFGGTAGYLLENNTFRNLKGSVKFASRTPGAEQIIVRNNRIQGVPSLGTSVGIEAVSYSNVFLENNEISDCGGFAMNIYSNPAPGLPGFNWGNYLIRNNIIVRCAKGIRISANPYKGGFAPTVSNINIIGNRIQVAAPKPIQMLNGRFKNSVVSGNRNQ